MARNCQTEQLATMIPRVLSRYKLTNEYRRALIFHNWPKIVGEDMARQVIPQKLNFKTLHVYIKNPVWANNFQYVKRDVINRINEVVSKNMVEEIQFSRLVIRQANKVVEEQQKTESFKTRLNKIQLSPEELTEFQLKVKDVENPEFQAKMVHLMILQAKRDKLRLMDHWENCEVCGKLIPPQEGGLCFECYNQEREERASELRAIFQIMPNVKFPQLEEYLDCTLGEYNQIKEETIQLWCSRLRPGVDYPDKRVKNSTQDYSLEAKMVTMLYRSVTPEELTKTLLARTIRKLKSNTAYWDLPKE